MLKPTTLRRLVPSCQTPSLVGASVRPARFYSTLKDTNPPKGRIPEGEASQIDLNAPGGKTAPIKPTIGESIEEILEEDFEEVEVAPAKFTRDGKRGGKFNRREDRAKDYDAIYRRGHIDMKTGQAIEYPPWSEDVAHKPVQPTVESLLKYWPNQANTPMGTWKIVKEAVDGKAKLNKKEKHDVNEKELVQGKYTTGEGVMAKVKQNPGFIGKEKEVMKVIMKRAPSLLE